MSKQTTTTGQATCLNLVLEDAERVRLLLEDYDYFVRHTDAFCQRLDVLTGIRGKATVDAWKGKVAEGSLSDVVQDLLTQHYDPVYLHSMDRHFKKFPQAVVLQPVNRTPFAMDQIARSLLEAKDA